MVMGCLGGLHNICVMNSFAGGQDNEVIDLILPGKEIDEDFLGRLIEKGEKMIRRRICCRIEHPAAARQLRAEHPEALLLWKEKHV